MEVYDVFLSHSSLNKEWVEDLKSSLGKYGVKSWLDKDEIRPGERFAEALELALENCNVFVLVVTTDAITSGWVKSEYYRALSIINNAKNQVEIIPVIKSKVPLPGFLSDRNHVDFTKDDYNKNVWRLVWGIKREKPQHIIDVANKKTNTITPAKNGVTQPSSNKVAFLSLPNIKKIAQELVDDIHNLIAAHGVDDDNWSQAISSQYFLAGIARKLGLTSQQDYKRLLNRFLRSFHHQIDETIVLDKDHILVTPKELRKIVECMKEEDLRDPYFANSTKTNWQNIDAWKLHYNYLYGLAVEISNVKRYKILGEIQSLAIGDLIYHQKQTALDDHGGWYPYRIPWITARILIGLKHSSIEQRKDYFQSKIVIENALESLIRRIYKNNYWRSGVGDWVSNWESTALCLEAFIEWNSIDKHNKKLKSVIEYSIEHESKWLQNPPDLSSEASSNHTLASVLMVCSILQILSTSDIADDSSVDVVRYLGYLRNVVSLVRASEILNSRQFCTIPQIAYYIIKAVSHTSEST